MSSLHEALAAVLPKDHPFRFHHLSTPPTKCDALYSAPPGERPDRTYCEKHFLAVSIETASKRLLALALEIYIYTTAHSTTLFVAKADSTGYLSLLSLPASPIRGICAAFITWLVRARRRKVRFVVSLFARAQSQYLFPGSVEVKGKHVLDDRGLVKWWCRVLNPLVEKPPSGWDNAGAYLVIPGLDKYETTAFVPSGRWTLAHPLERISHYTKEFDWVPPRCLVPQFPDDPKARFRDELDEEAARSGLMKTTGNWKSVKDLDTFWEMMAYRQECSSGRMTGFIWVVFDDEKQLPTPEASFAEPQTPKKPAPARTTTPKKLKPSREPAREKERKKSKAHKKKKKLRGPIMPRQPKIKTALRNYLLDKPADTAYYTWPEQGRGDRIVDEGQYKRIMELLLHLDFATLEKAAGSTRRWLSEVGMGTAWGVDVTGTMEVVKKQNEARGEVNVLGTGLVKRKREVNVLSAGMVRKKN